MHGHSLFYNKIFVAYIWAKFTFQISLLTVLKVWSMNRVSNLQQVIGITHGNNENGLIAGLCLLSHWWAKTVGLGETWSTPHPTTTAWLFFTEKPPCPLNSRGEEGRNDALDSSEAPTRLLVIWRSEALGSWHPSTGSYKHHFATLQVSPGSRCLIAAAQVSNSTTPPGQHI